MYPGIWTCVYKLHDVFLIINLRGLHLTDASSKWLQLWLPIPLWGHSNNSDSDPVQNTSSNQIGPVPCPKKANDKAIPVIELISLFHNSCKQVRQFLNMVKSVWTNVLLNQWKKGEYSNMNSNYPTIYRLETW